jgi:hypothetical protein
MTIEIKYDLRQEVYYINMSYESHKNYCELCNHSGRVSIIGTDKTAMCPECNGYGYQWSEKVREWSVTGASFIGQVRYQETFRGKIERQYMLDETGIGSGTVHNEINIFASEEEAQESCNHRNKNKLFDYDCNTLSFH